MEGSFKEIPDEAWWANSLLRSGRPVGTETYDKVIAIFKKYPKYFPCEAKYYSLPDEVHEAYYKEINGGKNPWIMPIFDNIEVGKGIEDQINNSHVVSEGLNEVIGDEVTLQHFKDFFNTLQENENRREKEKKERIAIFNKHYKKYGLHWQEGY